MNNERIRKREREKKRLEERDRGERENGMVLSEMREREKAVKEINKNETRIQRSNERKGEKGRGINKKRTE